MTVHVAVGTDTPHTHPAADGAAIGSTTHRDFRLFTTIVTGLNDGGVYVNLGSAVVMPEVFLKAVSVAVIWLSAGEFHYGELRLSAALPPEGQRRGAAAAQSGGKGYSITGHHEILLPLLAAHSDRV